MPLASNNAVNGEHLCAIHLLIGISPTEKTTLIFYGNSFQQFKTNVSNVIMEILAKNTLR